MANRNNKVTNIKISDLGRNRNNSRQNRKNKQPLIFIGWHKIIIFVSSSLRNLYASSAPIPNPTPKIPSKIKKTHTRWVSYMFISVWFPCSVHAYELDYFQHRGIIDVAPTNALVSGFNSLVPNFCNSGIKIPSFSFLDTKITESKIKKKIDNRSQKKPNFRELWEEREKNPESQHTRKKIRMQSRKGKKNERKPRFSSEDGVE